MAEENQTGEQMDSGVEYAASVTGRCVKVSYDFKRPNWLTYGHALFLETGADEVQAKAAIHRHEGDDVTITRLEMTDASSDERARFERKKARMMAWLANTRTGIPNSRGDL
jgi:hypothetical protein